MDAILQHRGSPALSSKSEPGFSRDFSPMQTPDQTKAPTKAAEALLRRQIKEATKRLENIEKTTASLKTVVEEKPSTQTLRTNKAATAYSILGELVDECVLDLIFETHREAKLRAALCQICNTKCRTYVSAPTLDIFGNNPTETEQYPCENCKTLQTSSRYAPHLEKCLGLSTRGAGRVARQRSGINPGSLYANNGQGYGARSISPYASNASEDRDGSANGDSDNDMEWGSSKKRKKNAKPVITKPKKLKADPPVDSKTKGIHERLIFFAFRVILRYSSLLLKFMRIGIQQLCA